MNKCLESCTGTAVIEWEQMILAEIPKEERADYIIKNGHTLRDYYCSEVCPVAKFNRKYHSQQLKSSISESPSLSEEDNCKGIVGEFNRVEETSVVTAGNPLELPLRSADIYIFEGGINDNT